jgi:hypothetical protein
MMRAAAAILMLLLASFRFAQEEQRRVATTQAAPTTAAVHFQSVDINIDPKGQSLAAYQLEFIADAGRVKLVGVEGGDHAAFREPPYYDPAALTQHRVVLAAFNTSADLPKAPTRVARLHLQISGASNPDWSAKLIVASSDKSDSIPATVSVSEGAKP